MVVENARDSCKFDVLFTKNVPHILEKIFFSLDYETYKQCLEVCSTWSKFLTSDRFVRVRYGSKPLHNAAMRGHKDVVQILIDQGVDCDRENQWGETPLWMAAFYGHTEVVKHLLDVGANPNKADVHGRTPLHCAARSGHRYVVQVLLEEGANRHVTDSDGRTPKDVLSRMIIYHLKDNDGRNPKELAVLKGETDVCRAFGLLSPTTCCLQCAVRYPI